MVSGISVYFLLNAGCNSTNSSATHFEGVVTYTVSAGAGLPPEASAMLKSMEIKTFVKGNLTRSEENIAGNRNIIIADSKKPGDPIMLVAMMGHKYAIRLNDSLKKLAEKNEPKIVYDDSPGATKKIAGYSCKKATITVMIPPNDSAVTSDMYYTADLPYADPQGQFKGLKGMPMEFSVNMLGENLMVTITAKSVEKETLPDSLFTIPSAYKEMSIDDVKKDLEKSMESDSAAGAKQ